MPGILEGVRVVEVAMWGFVPAAGAVLADWGAEVIKVEHPVHGDPLRGLATGGLDGAGTGVAPMWEIFNRGKRGIGIDIGHPDGRAVLMDLVSTADVFLTSFLPAARRKLGIDVADVTALNPRIVYARGSGQGARGPEAEKGGFDAISYWFRSGASAAVTPDEDDWPLRMPGPAFGDIQSGMMLAGGVGTALGHVQRTGEGIVVDTSLLAAGMWAMQPGIVATQLSGADDLPKRGRSDPNNPLSNMYRTADGRFVALSILQADRYWPEFCRALGRPDLAEDPRYATHRARVEGRGEIVKVLDEVFESRTLAQWQVALGAQEGQWDSVKTVAELVADRQAIANGFLRPVEHSAGREVHLVTAPVQFAETPPSLTQAPELGEHTEEILLSLGREWPEIIRLKETGAVT